MQSTKGRSLQEQDNLEWTLRPFGVVGGCVQNCKGESTVLSYSE